MLRINYKLYRGNVDRNLSVTYVYMFEPSGDFRTVNQRENGTVTILPSFGISISEGYGKDQVYFTANQYYIFASILERTVKMISDHLYELFPNAGKSEFEIDAKTLERFQTEKAIASNGITMVPCVWIDETNQCFPGVQITTLKHGGLRIPLQDAIPISQMFLHFDPHGFALSMLRTCGKID